MKSQGISEIVGYKKYLCSLIQVNNKEWLKNKLPILAKRFFDTLYQKT